MAEDWRPPHPYVPGQTARHAEDLFDPLKQLCEPIEDSPAWRAGLRFWRQGYYWEAHEMLEVVWMALPQNSADKCLTQGIIQLANALLKQVMGKPRAAGRLLRRARDLLDEAYTRSGGAMLLGMSQKDADQMYEESCKNVQNNA